MVKAVLFDLDGTLLDTNQLIYNSFEKTFKDLLGLSLKKEEIIKFFGIPLKDAFVPYFKEDEEDKIESYIKYYRTINEEIHDTMCFAFDGVKEMLDKLKEIGMKIGIVTSKREELAIRGMKIAGIYDYMDVIITPEKTILHKPNGEPAEEACNLLGIKPKEAIMVGDSSYDILCGNAAGCKTCAVEYSIVDIEELKESNPDYIIKRPIEILDIL
ncbi:pyrophosphatase PpaX [Clostridium sp.]|uniref:pyrophosphatase PpaX n=1 Tax=Clostridium sp. TaxID=1506 RepID=UPI0026268E17|nr:pyrophosphatase PpaX [Clostridium sp.]